MTFVIIEEKYWDLIDFDQCNEYSMYDVLHSPAGDKVAISFEEDQPDFCFQITNDTIGLTEYTYSELILSEKWMRPN